MLFCAGISFVLESSFKSVVVIFNTIFKVQNTFLGLNLFLEILIFLPLIPSWYLVLKAFFEMSLKRINIIALSSVVYNDCSF